MADKPAVAKSDVVVSLDDRMVSSRSLDSGERSQIAGRLRLTPAERLDYLMDVIAFEEVAHRSRRIG